MCFVFDGIINACFKFRFIIEFGESVLLLNLVKVYNTIPEIYITNYGAQFMFRLLKQNLFEVEPSPVLTILYI